MSDVNLHFPATHQSGVPFGTLHSTRCKEQFSIAYVHAIATAARCKLEQITVDDESVDATIRQKASHDILDSVSLDVQLKCTSQDIETKAGLSWPLSAKNWNDLSSQRRGAPAILVVLRVPQSLTSWSLQDTDQMTLARSAYWQSIRGEMPIPEDTSKTVTLPKDQTFNVAQLLAILQRIGNGGFP